MATSEALNISTHVPQVSHQVLILLFTLRIFSSLVIAYKDDSTVYGYNFKNVDVQNLVVVLSSERANFT